LEALKTKLQDRKATAAVIGLSYVGLPLALEIASAGFKVVGIYLDQNKIAALNAGKSYIGDASDKAIIAAKPGGSCLLRILQRCTMSILSAFAFLRH
jgi:UDP-N-acetyl-D-mannosaminuronate dehydrogenase